MKTGHRLTGMEHMGSAPGHFVAQVKVERLGRNRGSERQGENSGVSRDRSSFATNIVPTPRLVKRGDT